MLDIEKVRKYTIDTYNNAKRNIMLLEHRDSVYSSTAISDVIPGYDADNLKFGTYKEDNFSVLFIDIRSSTTRAKQLGAEKTFLTMHAFIPAMFKVVEHYNGVVIDIMGDGIMVFFGGKASELTKDQASKNAGLCGLDMLKVVKEVVNPILKDDDIRDIVCGVGVTYGKVIVTKIGIDRFFDVKAFGDCINVASKYSKGINCVTVDKKIKSNWPKSKGGRIAFSAMNDGYIIKDNR